MKIIDAKNIVKSFGGVNALDGMNFSMYENEIRCLAGENGCGKSTLIKIISGFHSYDGGDLALFNKHIGQSYSPKEAIASGIQVIYQDFALFSKMTIAENIMMYQTIGKGGLFKKKEIKQRASEVLKKINFNIDVDKYVYQLSVAEKQMVAICRALVTEPKLLIMDEPTTALTKKEVDRLFKLILALKEEGVAVLFVSHKLDEIYRICDSVTIMRNGKAVFTSTKGENLPSKEEIIYYMTGHQVKVEFRSFNPEGKRELMKVVDYTLEGCFSSVSFTLYEGEILGITGLLGCGRSEFAESLFGVLAADSGHVVIEGKDLGVIKTIKDAKNAGISYVPDDRLAKGLSLSQEIKKNALACNIDAMSDRSGKIKGKEVKEYIKQAFNEIQIPNLDLNNPVSSLSGGNQQKVVLIKWLATNPKVLLLNCPTVGVDVGAKSEILSLIEHLAQEKNVGVIVISDDAYELLQVCSRMLIMSDGKISHETLSEGLSVDDLERMINGEKRSMA